MKKIMPWILLGLVLIIMASIIVFPHNPAHDLFLRYLVTISSWPIIILILMLVLFFKFAPSIAELIRKPPKIRTPQGYEIGGVGQVEAAPINKEGLEEIKNKYEEERKAKEFYLQVIEFERIIRLLYRSQFLLLKSLSTYKTTIPYWPKSMVEETFYKDNYLKSGGNPNYPFEAYIGFLKVHGFISEEVTNKVPTIKILDKADLFLTYCFYMAYSENIFVPV